MSRKTRKEKEISPPRSKFFTLIVLVFILDRVSKILATLFLSDAGGIAVIPGVLQLTLVHNTGAAFGILRHDPTILTGISLGVVLIIVFFVRRRSLPWALVAGGALGNLADRLRFGYVIDFLDFHVWPVFNVADLCICIGVALLLRSLFKRASHSV